MAIIDIFPIRDRVPAADANLKQACLFAELLMVGVPRLKDLYGAHSIAQRRLMSFRKRREKLDNFLIH